MHYITSQYITLRYVTLRYVTLHYITMHYNALHYITLQCITLHYITLHYITLHHITSHYITLHYIHALHYITSHHITSHHITSHHITSHYITSHHITLHYITSHYITYIYIVYIMSLSQKACHCYLSLMHAWPNKTQNQKRVQMKSARVTVVLDCVEGSPHDWCLRETPPSDFPGFPAIPSLGIWTIRQQESGSQVMYFTSLHRSRGGSAEPGVVPLQLPYQMKGKSYKLQPFTEQKNRTVDGENPANQTGWLKDYVTMSNKWGIHHITWCRTIAAAAGFSPPWLKQAIIARTWIYSTWLCCRSV